MVSMLLFLLHLSILFNIIGRDWTLIRVWQISTHTTTRFPQNKSMFGFCQNCFYENIVRFDYVRNSQLQITDAVVLTKDNITLSVDIVLYYRIVNPIKAFYRINNIIGAIKEVTQSVVRNIFGEYTIQELLNDRLKVSEDLLESIENLIAEWGIYIEKTFIKDFQLSKELQQGLALAGIVKKETEAKIINAQANVEVAKFQREVSDVLNNEAAIQIRFLQTLGEITEAPSKKVVMMRM